MGLVAIGVLLCVCLLAPFFGVDSRKPYESHPWPWWPGERGERSRRSGGLRLSVGSEQPTLVPKSLSERDQATGEDAGRDASGRGHARGGQPPQAQAAGRYLPAVIGGGTDHWPNRLCHIGSAGIRSASLRTISAEKQSCAPTSSAITGWVDASSTSSPTLTFYGGGSAALRWEGVSDPTTIRTLAADVGADIREATPTELKMYDQHRLVMSSVPAAGSRYAEVG